MGFPSFTADASLEYKYLNRSLSIPDLGSGSGQLNFNLADLDDNEKNSARFVITVYDKGGSSKELLVPAKLANPLTFNLESDEYIYANEINPVTLAFQTRSTGTLNHVELQLLYDAETIDLIASTNPGVKTYEATPNIDFSGQTITDLNLLPSALTIHGDNPIPYKEMTLRAVLRESQGFEKTVERTLKLRSHIDAFSLEFPSTYDNDTGVPVVVNASLVEGKTATYSAAFDYKSYAGAWTSWQTWAAGTTAAANATKYTTDMSGVSAVSDVVGDNINKTYSYRFTVNCDDGTSFTKTRSMQLLRFNYEPAGGTWKDSPNNMNLSRGDYIEAQILRVKTSSDPGREGLLSIGKKINKWNEGGTYLFHFYLGDKASVAFRSACSYNGQTTGSGDKSHPEMEVNILLNKNGLFVDGKEGNNSGGYCNWDKNEATKYRPLITWLSNPDNASTIEVGQQEGKNRSGSTYHYIRVIRETEIPVP